MLRLPLKFNGRLDNIYICKARLKYINYIFPGMVAVLIDAPFCLGIETFEISNVSLSHDIFLTKDKPLYVCANNVCNQHYMMNFL